jgi:predicted O-methyltransferase YrrM
MKFKEVSTLLDKVPYMSAHKGSVIYRLISSNNITNILELGTAYGTGACYMAAALQEKGTGSVLTIDKTSSRSYSPNVFELIERCGLQGYIEPLLSESSYTWELMKIIEQHTVENVCIPIFDLCYIDGAHNFETDTCAFFLIDKLLKPGGYVLFDDLNWTYVNSPAMKNSDWVKNMPEEEKTMPHVQKIVNVVVKSHPNYGSFSIMDDWFLARKKTQDATSQVSLALYKTQPSILQRLRNRASRIARQF